MATTGPHFAIRAHLSGQADVPSDIGPKFLATLDDLSRTHEAFHSWEVVDNDRLALVPLADVRTDICWEVERGRCKYGDGGLFEDGGHWIRARSFCPRDRATFDIHVFSGSSDPTLNYVSLSGRHRHASMDEIATFADAITMFDIILAVWRPHWIDAIWYYQEMPPYDDPFPEDLRTPKPWILYLSAPMARGLEPSADFHHRRGADGSLILAVEHRFDFADTSHLGRSQILAKLRDAHTPRRR